MSESIKYDFINSEFWDQLYKNNLTGWDLGVASPPLVEYFSTITDKDAALLIPGCGNAYEATWLLQNGFTNITLIDIAPTVVANLLKRLENYIGNGLTLIAGDFFKHHGRYDYIIEQTFFCALDPALRNAYAAHMQQLLKPNGKLAGLLFDKQFENNPPFGGSKEEYQALFEPQFVIEKIGACTTSVKPRVGTELFFEMKKKNN